MTYAPSGTIPKIDVDELLKQIFEEEHYCQTVHGPDDSKCGKLATWVWIMDPTCEHNKGQYYICGPCHFALGAALLMVDSTDKMQCRRCRAMTPILDKRRIR